jgi:hypothetical protein
VYLLRRRDISGRNSRNEPGQPWKKARGMADGFSEKRAVKWMSKVSPESSVMLVLKAGNELMLDSSLRLKYQLLITVWINDEVLSTVDDTYQSKSSSQYFFASTTHFRLTPSFP